MHQNLKYIKRLRHIFAVLAWTIVGIYALIVVLLRIPAVQHYVASETAVALSEKLGTRVEVGNVNLGLLNRAIIDDIHIEDQQKHDMMRCHRLSAKIDILPLFKGEISISSAQIFSLTGKLTKANAEAPLNCQFIIDSLASKDTTSHTPLNLHISSLVIRNTALTYDRLDLPRKPNHLDVNHLSLDKISSHIILHQLTDDSLAVKMKKLSFAERNTDFTMNNMSFELNAGKHILNLTNLNLLTDHSDISIDAEARFKDKKLKTFKVVSKHSSVSMKDVACFVPAASNLSNTVFIDTEVTGTDKSLTLKNLSLRTSNKDLELTATGKATSELSIAEAMKHPESIIWDAKINRLFASGSLISQTMSAFGIKNDIVPRIGNLEYSLDAYGHNGEVKAEGTITTAVGQLTHDISLKGKHISAQLSTNVMKLGNLLATNAIGDTELKANVAAELTKQNTKVPVSNANVSITAPLLTISGYPYHNVKMDIAQKDDDIVAGIDVADLNINAAINVIAGNIGALLDGRINDLNNIDIEADINHFNPNALGLTNKWNSTTFALGMKATVASLGNPLKGLNANISNFTMAAPDDRFTLDGISISATETGDGSRDISFDSDFAKMHASGHFDPATLPQSFVNLVSKRLPTLPGMSQYKAQNNDIILSATIDDTSVLQKFLDIDIDAKSDINLNAAINDRLHQAEITLDVPQMTCFGMNLNKTRIHANCPGDTLNINASTTRIGHDGTNFVLDISGKAANNRLNTAISWQNGKDNSFKGSLNTLCQFFVNSSGSPTAKMQILPSHTLISDTLWTIHPSTISYSENRLAVNDFLVENGRQHIRIDGLATKSANDSLTVNLQDINVAYIMNLVDFHSVEFSGYASGNAVGKALFSEPQAYTDLDVRNFLFENGRLGTLTAHGKWDNALGQINIDAQCVDQDVKPLMGDVADFSSMSADALKGKRDGFVKVDGYISIKRNYIDLDIKAENARLEFIETYTDSFMNNINAWGNGYVRIVGPLNAINMTGEAVANGSVFIIPLNTTYTLHNDYVKMEPNEIIFKGDTIYDKYGKHGIVDGALHHRNLGRMTFDLDINAKNMLCFDFPTLNGSTFCGHVIGTGNCKITGRSGEVVFDIDAYPEETSYITYNASSPDALQNQEFITWRNVGHDFSADSIEKDDDSGKNSVADNFHTNIRLNFLIHATPAATLRLLMDEHTGDYITLNGSGTLRATYYNKGGMQIFGNYLVERGEYKMTIQQVINKNFEFLSGGTIAFGGDPFQAAIDLQAQYVVPSAPLSDLNIGNSFTSSTVRVNCLMNIHGTAEHPIVDFDLSLPQASTDIQQMITSLMDSEEERNQQVVYLLAIGRFYSANNNADDIQSQASLAMQSFLSGTVSQQLNNLISNVIIKDNNWNFGANISPGDEGMMNAEYEGLISGRMLNNRLLINGQFGYRDNVNATTSFIGDFDVRYLLLPNGNLQVKMYNQTSDRYFTKSNLNTQGLGIILKHDFNSFIPYFLRKKDKKDNDNR